MNNPLEKCQELLRELFQFDSADLDFGIYRFNCRNNYVNRVRIDHRAIAVIWRETEVWQKADFERGKQFVAEHKLAEGTDEIFVNGDSFIPGVRSLESVFKARMFAPVEG